jgi:hypothetical protein
MKLLLVIIKDSWRFQIEVAGNGNAFLASVFVFLKVMRIHTASTEEWSSPCNVGGASRNVETKEDIV